MKTEDPAHRDQYNAWLYQTLFAGWLLSLSIAGLYLILTSDDVALFVLAALEGHVSQQHVVIGAVLAFYGVGAWLVDRWLENARRVWPHWPKMPPGVTLLVPVRLALFRLRGLLARLALLACAPGVVVYLGSAWLGNDTGFAIGGVLIVLGLAARWTMPGRLRP